MLRMVVYTYYSNPWKLESGDDERIHKILTSIAEAGIKVVTFNLNTRAKGYSILHTDGVVYVNLPRKFYYFISEIVKWRNHYDLNPLMKITHYIDELLVAIKLRRDLAKAPVVMVFGSMSLFLFIIHLLGVKNIVKIYDPLANYAQTLYLRSRKSLIELLRYGLYLALHKFQIRSSDIVVYPSEMDLNSAKRMFKINKALVVPNPLPICYESIEEYLALRAQRRDFSIPYFVLLAGGRGKTNKEAVKTTIEVFNDLPPSRFKLFITGPWNDMRRFANNSSIEILGVIPHEKLKELLAIADYGLVPVFNHTAGTFLKTFAYLAAGLDVVTSLYGVQGVPLSLFRDRCVLLVRDPREYKEIIRVLVLSPVRALDSHEVTLCSQAREKLKHSMINLLSFTTKVLTLIYQFRLA